MSAALTVIGGAPSTLPFESADNENTVDIWDDVIFDQPYY
jgi:hypothetical protein